MAIDNSKYAQLQPFTLAGSGCILGSTSITLNSMLQIDGVTPVTMTDFGTKGFGTLEPGNGTSEEQIVFTGITQNSNGTATLTGVSNVLFISPYTETSGTAMSHPGGVTLVISNTAGFYDTFANKNDDATIVGKYTFPNDDVSNAGIATDTDTAVATAFVTLGQLSRQAISGASNASTTVKGIVQLPTQTQVDARTTTGSTGALLALTPDKQRSTLLSDYVADTGTANTYAIAPTPAVTAYAAGQVFSFIALHANTGTSTLNVSTLGTKTIKNAAGGNLFANDILVGQVVTVEYDGTNFQMLSPRGNLQANTLQSATTIVDVSAATAPTSGQVLTATASTTATWQTPGFKGVTGAGATTYDISTASGTQNIAHGLGVVPKMFNVIGSFPNTTNVDIATCLNGNSISAGTVLVAAGRGLNVFIFAVDASNFTVATITADATNIILTWTKNNSPTGTAQLTWSAFA